MLPGGRGNDFARVLGIPLDPVAACAVIAANVVRELDLGAINDRTFISIASCGFDSDANRIANETRLVRGNLVYAYGALRALARAFPMLRVIDTSPYDRRMRRFHNWMKDTPSFQHGPSEQFSFPPFSAWMVLTDGVSHACIAGQHALVDTFLVPLRNCRLPAPYHLLAGARA